MNLSSEKLINNIKGYCR